MQHLLFPELTNKKWSQINLNEQSAAYWSSQSENVLLDPRTCEFWVSGLHRKLGVDYSYGGYLENRSHLWHGSYLQKFVHLGIDFNVPSGTIVHSVNNGIVHHVFLDHDQDGGWGGRLVIKHDDGTKLIYAHMSYDLPKTGKEVVCGEIIGYVGNSHVNGGWFPHLHVQGFQVEEIPEDGYGNGDEDFFFPLYACDRQPDKL